jgi:hypothetical protein
MFRLILPKAPNRRQLRCRALCMSFRSRRSKTLDRQMFTKEGKTSEPRTRRFPLSASWHRLLWRAWDGLTPDERADCEERYEENCSSKGLGRIRGEISRRSGSRRHQLHQR